MRNEKNQKWLSLILAVIVVVGILAGCGASKETANVDSNPADAEQIMPTEELSIPLATNYIILGYPAELEKDVKVTYENIADGQKITFTTEFTGEELVLFHFTISASVEEGYLLGILNDAQAGELNVCMNVHDYSNGSLKPEDFNKINAMQERVNDIIIQFYEDERFVPSR